MVKPLGNRVIVSPDRVATETESGLVIPDSARKDPAMSGTVVSVGRGPESAVRIRTATIARCMKLLDDVAERVPSAALRTQLMDEFARYQMEQVDCSGLKEGDRVCFPYTAGQHLTVDDQGYIVLREDDIVATWTPEEEAMPA